jgi:hypothetical protein
MAAYAELTIDQGTDFETAVTLSNDDGSVIDVTNYSFECQIRKSYYSSNATANLVVSIVDAPTGNERLSLDAANTANIRAGRYLYDFKMTTDDTRTLRVFEGIVTVTPQVSK